MDARVQELRKALNDRRVMLIIGAGVTLQATNHAETASWKGLIRSGIDHAATFGAFPKGSQKSWSQSNLSSLRRNDPEQWILTAQDISRKLNGPESGEWRAWLRAAIGSLQISDRSLLSSIAEFQQFFDAIVATTNYDGILEKALKMPPVTWSRLTNALKVLTRKEKGILHLHGYWEEPQLVVLGLRSYDDLLKNSLAQSAQKSAALTNILIFIGCGGGLDDPNLGVLIKWINKELRTDERRHFVLLRDDHAKTFERGRDPEGRLFAVSYGDHYNPHFPNNSVRH